MYTSAKIKHVLIVIILGRPLQEEKKYVVPLVKSSIISFVIIKMYHSSFPTECNRNTPTESYQSLQTLLFSSQEHY